MKYPYTPAWEKVGVSGPRPDKLNLHWSTPDSYCFVIVFISFSLSSVSLQRNIS